MRPKSVENADILCAPSAGLRRESVVVVVFLKACVFFFVSFTLPHLHELLGQDGATCTVCWDMVRVKLFARGKGETKRAVHFKIG